MVRRPLHHVLPKDRDTNSQQRLGATRERFIVYSEAGIGPVRNQSLRQPSEGIARVVVAGRRILHGVEHLRRVGQRSRVDTSAVDEPLVPDPATVRQDPFGRQQRRNAVSRGRPLARGTRLLTDADGHQVCRYRDSRAAARSARHALGIVRVTRLARPRTDGLAARDRVCAALRFSTWVARSAVELMSIRFRVNDRAPTAQPGHDCRIERRNVHGKRHVAVGGRSHVFRVERIFERGDDAVHR